MNIENRIESTKKELRFSNLKIWGILFLFSFLVIVWIRIFPEIFRTINFIFPIIFATLPWLLWTTYQFILFRPRRFDRHLKDYLREEFSEFENEYSEQTRKRLFYEYESLMISLSKQRRVSRLIELLVAFELALLPLIFSFINFILGW
jgi:hypothetical protein